jgi:hypothetical protein
MSDLLATAEDLRALLDGDATTLPDAKVGVLLRIATGSVQAAARQEIVLTLDDPVEVMGTSDQWFDLPQIPAISVSAVEIDGTVVTDYKRIGSRLWRRRGWASICDEPSLVAVTYSHGYPEGSSKLGLAESTVLALAARWANNPDGAVGMSIDDFSKQYSQSSNSDLAGLIPDRLQKLLRTTYGPRGRFVRTG